MSYCLLLIKHPKIQSGVVLFFLRSIAILTSWTRIFCALEIKNEPGLMPHTADTENHSNHTIIMRFVGTHTIIQGMATRTRNSQTKKTRTIAEASPVPGVHFVRHSGRIPAFVLHPCQVRNCVQLI